MSNWLRVNKSVLCPICEKNNWCMISKDGKSAFCMRVDNGNLQPNGGWIHKLTDDIKPFRLPRKQKKEPKLSHKELCVLSKKYMDDADLGILCNDLFVSRDSLERLCVGYDKEMKCWTFPMRDGHGYMIGIRTRFEDAKRSYPGSRNGLFIPRGVVHEPEIAIVEGPTDTAALLDIGVPAIGRASCNSCVELVKDYINKFKTKSIIIVADNDKAKIRNGKKYYPGQDGAKALAKALYHIDLPIKIIKPVGCKDCRDWKQNGLTKELFYNIVRNNRRYI